MVQALIADSVLDLESSRLMIQRCAWELDQRRRRARHESSAAKVFVGRGGRPRRRPRGADLRLARASPRTCRSAATSPRCARSASTTARPRRTAGRSPAARPATARGPSARADVARTAAVEIVDTPRAGGAALGARAAPRAPPARGLPRRARPGPRPGRARSASATATRTSPTSSSATARASCCAARRARRCRRRRTTCCARRACCARSSRRRCAVPQVLAACDDAVRARRAVLRHAGASRARR